MNKKSVKIFTEYSDAFIYCVLNDIKNYRVVKHSSNKGGSTRNWFVFLSNGKPLKA